MGNSKKNVNYFNNDYGKGNHVKELFANAIKQHENNKISDEKIEQAFAIIDSHSRLLNDYTMINNYNIVVQVIGTIITSKFINEEISEESLLTIIKEYFSIYIDYDELNKDEEDSLMKNYRSYIEDYVINSCMTYFAIYKKDKELLSKYNKSINEALKNMLTIKNKMFQREMIIKNQKEGIKMPVNKKDDNNDEVKDANI